MVVVVVEVVVAAPKYSAATVGLIRLVVTAADPVVVAVAAVLNLIALLSRQLNQRNNSHAIALPDIVVGRSPFRSRVLRS